MLSEIIRASADKGRSAILAVALLLSLAPAAAQEKLNVGALRFVSNGGLFVAVERGYFKAAGVEIALKFFDAAQPIAVATVSGDIDLGATAFTAGLYNLAGKGGLKVIAAQAREKKGSSSPPPPPGKKAFAASRILQEKALASRKSARRSTIRSGRSRAPRGLTSRA